MGTKCHARPPVRFRSMAVGEEDQTRAPRETPVRLFLRFLRFGALAWGGPVAQIDMIRQELVEEELWISRERFNRVLGVYQALPGPEAHELCVYFGHAARGTLGGFLAGLGFMLPGFSLMLVLAWAYVRYGLRTDAIDGVFYGLQAAVIALILRAIHRIGGHALTHPVLWGIAGAAAIAETFSVPFGITLAAAGLIHAFARRRHFVGTVVVVAVAIAAGVLTAQDGASPLPVTSLVETRPGVAALFWSGLKAGLLTFGGAYTVIPFLRNDAVGAGGWMTDSVFLDGIALGGILPAPLVIFGTFVGYVVGGLPGAVAITAGIFLPAFSFTLIGHRQLERIVHNRATHAFLDGLTAGVVGLIATTAARLTPAAIPNVPAALIALAALIVLFRWRSKASIAAVMFGAGLIGFLIRGL